MFYVYELIDPRNGKVFYIGKGKGNRAWQHEIEARSGACGNNWQKYCTIKSIISADLCVEVRIVKEFDIESEAYYLEKQLISSTKGLTNIAEGGEIMCYMFKLPKKEEAKHRREIENWVKSASVIADKIEINRQAERTDKVILPRWVRRDVPVEVIDGPLKGSIGKIIVITEERLVRVEIGDISHDVPIDWIRGIRGADAGIKWSRRIAR